MAALANPAFLYVGSDKYAAAAQWAASTVKAAGALVRQLAAPTLGNERVFVCIIAGTTGPSELTWTVTKGAKNAEAGGPTWQECTGQPAVNGDATNTKDWNSAKSNTVALGQIIKNIAGTFYFICTTAGTSGSGAEPTWNTTAGVTTADNTVTWTSIGAVGNFAAFAAPHQRILNADSANWQTVAGSTIYISNAHAETQASAMSLAGGTGTAANQNQYICVSNATAPPSAATTGATVSTTGASSLTVNGSGYYEGITFQAGSAANAANLILASSTATAQALYFENCGFTINNTATTSNFILGSGGSSPGATLVTLNNCSLIFGNASQAFEPEAATISVVGGSMALTGTAPSTLIKTVASDTALLTVRDCDISGVTGTLCNFGTVNTGYVVLQNCKLGAAVAMTSGTSQGPGAPIFKMHNCDSGSKNYRFYENSYLASVQQETTTTNNAGASDGTQIISWNIATTANTHFGQPYISPEVTAWQDTTGSSKTATVEIAGANTLNNDDIWIELEYPGNASFPIASTISSRKTDAVTANAVVTTSTASWGGSPAHTQKLQVTFTPQMKGPVKARIYVAKPSITVFVDPLLTIT